MAEYVIEEIDGKAEDFGREIDAILDEAAIELGRPFRDGPFNLRATDGEGNLLGGLSAYDFQGWLYVRLLGVKAQARGTGIGRALMERAEAEARRRGHVGVYVDTFDFQAPDFYPGIGYVEFGRLPAVGGQPVRIFFAKPFGA